MFDWKVTRKLLFTLLFQLSKSFKEKMTHIHPIKVLYMSTENTQMLFISFFFFFYLYPLLNSHSYIIINLSMEYFIRNRKYIFFSTKQKFYELIKYIRLILNTWNKHERMETVPPELRSIDSFFLMFSGLVSMEYLSRIL